MTLCEKIKSMTYKPTGFDTGTLPYYVSHESTYTLTTSVSLKPHKH